MNLIVAVDRNWAIGRDNKLLVNIPQDMKFFRQITAGKVVVMGRKTLESLPGGQPLKLRTNMVLSANTQYRAGNAMIFHTVKDLLSALVDFEEEDIYIIGGESVYRQLLPCCRKAYVTKVDHSFEADAYFPNLDQDDGWQMIKTSEEQTYFDLEYVFTIYERID